jgi:hypothetical protein
MKNIFASILCLLLFSCNQETSTNDKKLTEKSNNLYVTDNTEIIGNWTMCATSWNGMMTQYNVCPNVSFLNNGKGYVGNAPFLAEHFNWTLKKGILNISYKDTISNSTFSEALHDITISKHNDRLDLVIRQTKNDNVFYLSR